MRLMHGIWLVVSLVPWTSPTSLARAGESPPEITFKKQRLSELFFCEGATFGDFNKDSKGDVVSGPYWYEGPDFTKRHELAEPKPYDPLHYSENFFAFVYDFDKDGWNDVFFIAFPGKRAWWARNPQGKEQHWDEHEVIDEVSGESPTFVDVNGDGRPDLVCRHQGRWGYATFDPADAAKTWTFHPISADLGNEPFIHGMGVGDINGDGKPDLLEVSGWWEQPKDLKGDPPWVKHETKFGPSYGGAQMLVYDIDGDGDNDVVSSISAHAYGLSWFEQVREGNKKDGAISFVEHHLMGEKPEECTHGINFTELHALDLVDIDGDGLKDFVTGKRFWAHGPSGPPGAGDPAVLYWWKLVRKDGKADFEPHLIDNDSGVGVQVVAGDIDGDGKADVVVGNKKGTFVFLQQAAGGGTKSGATPAPAPAPKKQADLQPREKGTLPVGLDGHPLNTDFETGDLRDWTFEGDAFANQPVRGDLPAKRHREPSLHRGEYWIGGYEPRSDGEKGDVPQGMLLSAPFKVTKPWASFLIGGGANESTALELVREGEQQSFFRCTGANSESLQPIAIDLHAELGATIRIRLVDDSSGGWGHLNFDDFLVHEEEPLCVRPAGVPEILPPDPMVHAGLPPAEAAKAMTVPPGFAVDVIAGEPDVYQPIAFAIDGKGRIWVAEAVSYPWRQKEGEGKDSIVVFTDRDHDGSYETKTVFAEHLNLVSGLEVGFGGVFVGAAPYLYYIPDRDDDLKPDGPPEVLLDGFGFEDTHETLNAFNWGPDGWLYGCHGVFTHSKVGKPGTPDDQRVKMNAAVWRYHPLKQQFEIFGEGTSNPWGVDFDDFGDSFCTACVIPHLYHIIQGGRYIRQAGSSFNPYTYTEIDTIADHRHWAGDGPYAAIGRSAKLGGGHAHAGAMVYLGGAFPDEYRNTIFMGNIHGNRINNDRFEVKGSGFVGHHANDFLVANDKWFRQINCKYGPDGAVYFIDWYDKHACHQTPGELWDRTNGRIYRVRFGEEKPRAADIAKLDDRQLVQEHLEQNDWWVRQSRKELERRGGSDAVAADLRALIATQSDATRRLRAMWTLHAIDRFTEADAVHALDDQDAHVRGFGVQLACEKKAAGKALLDAMATAAAKDPSPVVRRFIASALQRLPLESRWNVLAALITHVEDADDPNLPSLDWYALEPLVPADPVRALALSRDAERCRLASLREFIVRRAAADASCHDALVASLAQTRNVGERRWMLQQIHASLREQRGLKAPSGWPSLYAELKQDPYIDREALDVAIDFGDPSALPEAREAVANRGSDVAWRLRALDAVVRAQDPAAPALLMSQLNDAELRGPALRALAGFADPKTPAAILGAMKSFTADERHDALTTLSARASWATELLNALGRNDVARADFSATVLRRLRDLKNPEVDLLITKNFGLFRDSPEDKKKRIAELEAQLTPDVLAHADRQNGRALFSTICMKCHTLFGMGKAIAPDLTGANRADLDYLVSNAVDPNAVIGKEYQVTNVWLKNGNVVSGILSRENESALTLIAENETVVVAKSDVDVMKPSATSLMPEGQLDPLPADDVRDLFGYLQSRSQVAIKATAASAPWFFDNKTLAFWSGDPALWSVEGGGGTTGGNAGVHCEIVGRTASGIQQNAFLVSDFEMKDFRLTLDLKLVDDAGNSGVQFRTESFGDAGEVKGCQADVGPGWWGKLYEENGRGILVDTGGEAFVKKGDWNHYEIVCTGARMRLTLNGHVTADVDDPLAAKGGRVALQLHAGGPTEVRFRDLDLEVDPPALPPVARAAGSQ